MRLTWRFVAGSALFLAGYAWGTFQPTVERRLLAQDQAEGTTGAKKSAPLGLTLPAVSDDTRTKIKAAADALNAAVEALKQDNLYAPATKGINVFGVLSGSCTAIADLQSNAQVDPDTFAMLYAGLASDEIVDRISYDPEGRLTFNNKIVKVYPISKLRTIYQIRSIFTGEDLMLKPDIVGAPKKPSKDADPAAQQ